MTESNPEHMPRPDSHEDEHVGFTDKFRELLPNGNFEEPIEMLEARRAVLEALEKHKQEPELLQTVWSEYAAASEQIIDAKTPSNGEPQARAQLQVAALVHKALIFRETGDMRRYCEELVDAEEYAFNAQLSEISEAIGAELDTF
ncbi:MAG TPA: hypothetical protein VK502_01655 [Candidatus Saccharimonadales bacterium]|nr:hypothetical protein [Candidatus Saccharimonadales bacterium]